MVDGFSILLSHALIAFAVWRLLSRDDLDKETPVDPAKTAEPAPKKQGWAKRDA